MKFNILRKKLKKYPYVTKAFFCSQGGSRKTLENQLVSWIKNGEIIRLRRGLYTLPDGERGCGLSKPLIANVLYYPSYVSLEYALGFWGMIPEAVYAVTSVTPKKTQEFLNSLGEFVYKNIKKDLFFGFVSMKDEFGSEVLFATPEKALLDFFYLNTPANLKKTKSYFEESLRLQNIDQLNFEKMSTMVDRMKSAKISRIFESLLKHKDEL